MSIHCRHSQVHSHHKYHHQRWVEGAPKPKRPAASASSIPPPKHDPPKDKQARCSPHCSLPSAGHQHNPCPLHQHSCHHLFQCVLQYSLQHTGLGCALCQPSASYVSGCVEAVVAERTNGCNKAQCLWQVPEQKRMAWGKGCKPGQGAGHGMPEDRARISWYQQVSLRSECSNEDPPCQPRTHRVLRVEWGEGAVVDAPCQRQSADRCCSACSSGNTTLLACERHSDGSSLLCWLLSLQCRVSQMTDSTAPKRRVQQAHILL